MLTKVLKFGNYLISAFCLVAAAQSVIDSEWGFLITLLVLAGFFALTAWHIGTPPQLMNNAMPSTVSSSGSSNLPETDETEKTDQESKVKNTSAGPPFPQEGITDSLDGLNTLVWDRGYYCETDEGTWYEVYVTEDIKKEFPVIDVTDEDWEHLSKFQGLLLDHYEDDGQITIFVPSAEEDYTLDELADNFV